MTYEEFCNRQQALYDKVRDLKVEFLEDNPFNEYIGKVVNIRNRNRIHNGLADGVLLNAVDLTPLAMVLVYSKRSASGQFSSHGHYAIIEKGLYVEPAE